MSRWIIVSNRLPVSWDADKKALARSSGGLVTAIESIKTSSEKVWIGVAPNEINKRVWNEHYKYSGGTQLHPMFMQEELYHDYYNNFCNDLLWPLFHYETDKTSFNESSWDSYVRANQMFANEILKVAKPGDLVWIHDFHLCLVPQMLREKRSQMKIGFFLHIPFPSSEVFRQLPHRREILYGLLASDLIGFHDYSYLRHFCSTVLRVLGIDSTYLSIRHKDHIADLGVFPVSIDTPKVHRDASAEKTNTYLKEIESERATLLGIDRLDYTKGLELKLLAFQKFLRANPEWHEKVRLIQVAVPSRTNVPVYQQLKNDIDSLVGEINGEFSTPKWTPIRYIFSSVPKHHLLALYRCSDALLVTSRRDGMNLVALEFIAAQQSRPGVLLLSEFTGAMSMLSETVAINPWNPDQVAEKIKYALNLTPEERNRRWEPMYEYLKGYTASDWADSFMQKLHSASPTESLKKPIVSSKKVANLLNVKAKDPLNLTVLLDYDGTLVPICERPEDAVITRGGKAALNKLIKRGADVVIVSGRPRDFLEDQLGDLPLTLAGEHGAHVRYNGEQKWTNRVGGRRPDWYKTALQIMNDYAKRVPNSFVERKAFAIAWHYRQSPNEYAGYVARKLLEELEATFATAPASILSGKKVIEVRAVQANKGFFAREYLRDHGNGRKVLAIGDDATDEDLFKAVRDQGVTIRVGHESTSADYIIPNQDEVHQIISSLI